MVAWRRSSASSSSGTKTRAARPGLSTAKAAERHSSPGKPLFRREVAKGLVDVLDDERIAPLLQPGKNTLQIIAAPSDSDIDDFEFVNVQVRLSP